MRRERSDEAPAKSDSPGELDGPSGNGEPDDAIVRRVVAGEVDAFELLVARHVPAAAVAEVAQDAFVTAYVSLSNYAPTHPFARWRRRAKRFGDLQDGGSLYAMVIDPDVVSTCDGSALPTIYRGGGVYSVDTRRNLRSFLGQPLPVRWELLEDVDPPGDTLRFEAHTKGAALIDRGEGAWYTAHGGGKIYFVATSGGDDDNGQIFSYDPKRETVTLVVESTTSSTLDNPDNITVAPDGALYLCEDGGGTDYVVGVDRNGDVFPFLSNALDTGEFAGACFSPNGKFMYVNAQSVGITFAVFREDGRSIRIHSGWARSG